MKKSAVILLLLFACIHLLLAQKADTKEIGLLVDKHNFWRTDVGVEDISYSNELAEVANQWAIELKTQGCSFKHSENPYGENLFKGTIGYFTVGDAVDFWGAEKHDYDYKNNKCLTGKVCGHYTQIVWKNTTEVGCAKTLCDGSVIWVCNYNPIGNYVGQLPY